MIIPFMLSSQFFLNYDPVDYWVFAFSLLGVVTPLFSIGALLVKLPIGAPAYVWDFILHSPESIGFNYNWPRYGLIGAWWIGSLLLYIKKRRGKARLPTGLSQST